MTCFLHCKARRPFRHHQQEHAAGKLENHHELLGRLFETLWRKKRLALCFDATPLPWSTMPLHSGLFEKLGTARVNRQSFRNFHRQLLCRRAAGWGVNIVKASPHPPGKQTEETATVY